MILPQSSIQAACAGDVAQGMTQVPLSFSNWDQAVVARPFSGWDDVGWPACSRLGMVCDDNNTVTDLEFDELGLEGEGPELQCLLCMGMPLRQHDAPPYRGLESKDPCMSCLHAYI